jgi:hypothetical protein
LQITGCSTGCAPYSGNTSRLHYLPINKP